MTLFLLVLFTSERMLLFYFAFECVIIPIFFLILGWGSNVERLHSGVYMLMYTLIFSLPLLMGILRLGRMGDRMSFSYLYY